MTDDLVIAGSATVARGTGWRPDMPDHRDHSYNAEARIVDGSRLPGTVDLWPHVPPIWDQLNLGSCTSHSTLRALLITAIKQGIPFPMLSRLMQYFNERYIEGSTGWDAGAQVRDGIKALVTWGCCPESEWPYDVQRFAERPSAQCFTDALKFEAIAYKRIDTSGPGAPMRTALNSGLGIAFGFRVPQNFQDGSWDPSSEVLMMPTMQGQLTNEGHSCCITGYDFTRQHFPVDYFIVDNSWNVDWGGAWGGRGCSGGRFAMQSSWFTARRGLASDLWVIEQ